MNLNKDCECSKCTFSVDSIRIWIPWIQDFQHFMERDSKRTNKKTINSVFNLDMQI